MQLGQSTLTVQLGSKAAHVDATHVRFSAHKCFQLDGGAEDLLCLDLLAAQLARHSAIVGAIDDAGRFLEYLLKHRPELRDHFVAVTQPRAFGARASRTHVSGLPVIPVSEIASHASTVFMADTRMFPRMQMRRRVPPTLEIVDIESLAAHPEHLPARAWTPWARDVIYPIDVPEIEFQRALDVLLIDCPARNLGLMPNGVGYVHNALKHTGLRCQTLDLDIIIYHRYHVRRILDEGGTMRLANGRELPSDPWQADQYDIWTEPDMLDFMAPEIDEIVTKIIEARPKVLAMSIQSCNEAFSTKVVQGVRAALPDIVVLVGGFSCYNADIGLRAFPHADYMCIGEADLTVGALVERLAAGERPKNVPGVMSKEDDPAVPFIPAPMPHDLDLIEHPRYEWFDLDVYKNYNGYQLTPVIASRGCRWSRCTFCAERFYWRIRSAPNFVDELEWLVAQGCHLFMFNESDLNGMPEKVLEICDEIIRRQVKVKLTGQLRIHKKSDRAYFEKLREAGFGVLRFGVDAFSENTLRLQKKGYTKATVRQNLRDCWEAGIYTEVNWVIGVPGETEDDVTEGIEFINENKPYIGRLANFNPLILINGGVYWLEPEKHGIVFRMDKDFLYKTCPRSIPAHLWYSTDPYIDEFVRKDRLERIVLALHEGGFKIDTWASRVIEDVRKGRDVSRAGDRLRAAERRRTQEAEDSVTAEPRDAASVRLSEPSSAQESVEREPVPLRMSDGVGSLSEPEAAAGELTFNPDARASAYLFRAGSSLPQEKIARVDQRVCWARYGDEVYVVPPDVITSVLGDEAIDGRDAGTTVRISGAVSVRSARTQGAVPELIRSVGTTNVVQFDGQFFAVPQSLGAIDWGVADVRSMPGVTVSKDLRQIVRSLERLTGSPRRSGATKRPHPAPPALSTLIQIFTHSRRVPHLVGTLENYNIVEYEGWYYGLPMALGEVHLEKTDVIEMPGVIRDLSRDVVEGEIREITGKALA